MQLPYFTYRLEGQSLTQAYDNKYFSLRSLRDSRPTDSFEGWHQR
jgi:hypothetical protein